MATIDLFSLIFTQILKISPDLLYKYPTIQDQIINLIFLPHVILFLFIWGFGMMLMPPEKERPNAHRGLRYLVSVAAYVFIIYQGWYGTFLIPLLQTWFYVMLIFGLFLFFISKIYHPVTAARLGDVGRAVGQSAGEKMARGKQIEALEDELKFVKKRIGELKRRDPAHNTAAQFELENYERQKHELEKAIKKLGG
jgi:hypothetical protein